MVFRQDFFAGRIFMPEIDQLPSSLAQGGILLFYFLHFLWLISLGPASQLISIFLAVMAERPCIGQSAASDASFGIILTICCTGVYTNPPC